MRCPKCGYTSFDHLDSCKKCGKDLMEFKERFGIKSVLFPGQMTPVSSSEEENYDTETADAAVVAATAGVAAAAAAGPVVVDDNVESSMSDSDDFGFDFMGDSAEDDDLSFDELFEEAPEDEDVEETIEAPKAPEQVIAEENAEDEEVFSFDLAEDDEALEDDFGFDPMRISGRMMVFPSKMMPSRGLRRTLKALLTYRSLLSSGRLRIHRPLSQPSMVYYRRRLMAKSCLGSRNRSRLKRSRLFIRSKSLLALTIIKKNLNRFPVFRAMRITLKRSLNLRGEDLSQPANPVVDEAVADEMTAAILTGSGAVLFLKRGRY